KVTVPSLLVTIMSHNKFVQRSVKMNRKITVVNELVIGKMIRNRIVKSLAPSNFAASINESGMALKKFEYMKIAHILMTVGIIIPAKLSNKPPFVIIKN